jgi:hypothetical protein
MAAEGASLTRQSRRERVQTPKPAELSRKRREMRDQNESSGDDAEDTIVVIR